MGNIDIYSYTYFNTTSAFISSTGFVDNWTSSAANLFNRKKDNYFSAQLEDNIAYFILDLGICSIDRIACNNIILDNIGVLAFRRASSVFELEDGNTSSAYWNSSIPEGDLLMKLPSTTALTDGAFYLYFEKDNTATSASIKIGNLYIGEREYTFNNNPSKNDYTPKFERFEKKHSISDGGISVYRIQDNFHATIKDKYVGSSDYSSLKSIYQSENVFTFVPMPTGTGWDGEIYEVNWVNDFDLSYTDSIRENGYNLTIKLEETPK